MNNIKLPPTKDKRCGTMAGYQVHRRKKENSCVACKKANALYSALNYDKPKISVKSKKYYLLNKEKIKEKNSNYYYLNHEESKKRRLKNPEKRRENNHRYRANKLKNKTVPYTEQQVLEKYGTNCHICKLPINLKAPRQIGKIGWRKGLHIDHVKPISKDGSDSLRNVRPSHGLCNVKKHNFSSAKSVL